MTARETIPIRVTPEGSERFMSRVEPELNTGCNLWSGARTLNGYGSFWNEGVFYIASRYSYAMHYGQVPDGLHVLHKCDTPACVNPAHLYAGTHGQNMRDISARGRSAKQRHYNRLSEADCAEIDRLLNEGLSPRSVAKRLGRWPSSVRRYLALSALSKVVSGGETKEDSSPSRDLKLAVSDPLEGAG